MQARSWTLSILNAFGLLLVVFTNYLAVSLPLNGRSTGELSALYPNLFVPAGFTFSIWGIIYISLLLWISYQFWFTIKKRTSFLLGQRLVGLWFLASCVFNIAWIFAWHYELPGLALLVMILLLFTLIQIYRNLGIGLRETSHRERFFMHLPFSVYLAWISVATIANTTAFLVSLGFEGAGLPPEFYAAIMLTIAGLLALFFLNYNVDVFFSAVIIWAAYGIFHKHYYTLEQSYPVVYTSALAVIFLLIVKYLQLRSKCPKTRAYW